MDGMDGWMDGREGGRDGWMLGTCVYSESRS